MNREKVKEYIEMLNLLDSKEPGEYPDEKEKKARIEAIYTSEEYLNLVSAKNKSEAEQEIAQKAFLDMKDRKKEQGSSFLYKERGCKISLKKKLDSCYENDTNLIF